MIHYTSFPNARFAACGPKNNGRFAYWHNHQLRTGLNHKPMTKPARERFLRLLRKSNAHLYR